MNISAIKQIAEKHQNSVAGTLGFGFLDLKSGESFFLNEHKAMPAASVFKVFLLAELMRRVDIGEISLTDRIALKESLKSPGSGVMRELDEGASLTVKDYATMMMIISDNTATDVLFDLVGREGIIENILEPYGFTQTKCDWNCKKLIMEYLQIPEGSTIQYVKERRAQGKEPNFRNTPHYLCQTEQNDQTSMADIVKTFDLIYKRQLVSKSASEKMLDIMLKCQTNTRIPKLLPIGVEVAHKTGTMGKVANDVGIVYTSKGDYVLALFYNGNTASEQEFEANEGGAMSTELLAKISKDVYDCFMV